MDRIFSSLVAGARVGSGDRRWSVAGTSRAAAELNWRRAPQLKKERLEQRLLQPFHVCVHEQQCGGAVLSRSTTAMLYSMKDATKPTVDRGHDAGRGFPCRAHALLSINPSRRLTERTDFPAPTPQWPAQPVSCAYRPSTHRVQDGRITRSTACSLSRACSSCHQICAANARGFRASGQLARTSQAFTWRDMAGLSLSRPAYLSAIFLSRSGAKSSCDSATLRSKTSP